MLDELRRRVRRCMLRAAPAWALRRLELSGAELGWTGERIAERFLRAQGARWIARRWRTRAMEVDLLIEDGAEWAVVEVKAGRIGPRFRPRDRLDVQRLRRLHRAARIVGRSAAQRIRVDLVEVLLTREGRLRGVVWYRDLGTEHPARPKSEIAHYATDGR